MKNFLLLFQIIQILVISVFLIFVSDLRKKNKTKQLISPFLLGIMKVTYFLPLVLFLWSVFTMRDIYIKDWLALLLTIIGLIIVICAKTALGKFHSWTGYGAYPTSFCSSGIYSFIRHPMYLGIYLCITGMIVFIFKHLPFPLLLVDAIGSGYIFFILNSSAKKETIHLGELFGSSFKQYCDEVPEYLPKLLKRNS